MPRKPTASSRPFPTFAIIVLAIGVVWLLNDLHVLNIDLPWLPIILIIVGVGMIANNAWRHVPN